MSHTPGPWMHLSGGHVTTTAGPDWPSHVVADCGREEDAHAIAALPAMLKALDEILCAWDAGETPGDMDVDAMFSAVAHARDVYRWAHGRGIGALLTRHTKARA